MTDITDRISALTKLVKELEEANDKLAVDNYNLSREVDKLRNEIHGLLVYRDHEEARVTKKEIIEDLCHKVADIKYDLQVVLDTLYQLENSDSYDEETTA